MFFAMLNIEKLKQEHDTTYYHSGEDPGIYKREGGGRYFLKSILKFSGEGGGF